MLNVFKFNLRRNLRNKTYLISLAITIFLSIIFWTIWFALSFNHLIQTSLIFHWIGLVVWLIFLSLINLVFLSNTMLTDIESGIQSLEVRRGVNIKWLFAIKFLSVKIFTIASILIAFCIFALTLALVNPVEKSIFSNIYLPGLCVLFVYDFLISGIIILIGSLLKIKLLMSLASFMATLFVLSPILGVVHFLLIKDYKIIQKGNDNHAYWKKIVDITNTYPEGYLKNLLDNLSILNNVKQVIEYEPNDAEIFDINLLYKYYLNLGSLLDLPTKLNAIDEFIHQNVKFKFTTEFQTSKLYAMFDTITPTTIKGKFEATIFSKIGSQNWNGTNQLNDYAKWLKQEDTVTAIKQALKIEASQAEMQQLNDLVLTYYNFYFLPLEKFSVTADNEPKFCTDSTVCANIKDFATVKEQFIYPQLKVKNGNQLYTLILFEIISGFASYKAPEPSDETDKSIYERIVDRDAGYQSLFYANPLMPVIYMSLFSGSQAKIEYDQLAARTLISEGPEVQGVEFEINPKAVQDHTTPNKYPTAGNYVIADVKISGRVISTYVFYLVYLSVALVLSALGYLIYLKKIKL